MTLVAKSIIAIVMVLSLLVLFTMKQSKDLCFKDKCFEVEIADTFEARTQGLMFRQDLKQGKAMLFVFQKEGVYSFHMRNVNFPLDIVWLNENKEIVFIKTNALPEEEGISPDKEAKYVIEFNAGVIKSLGAGIGDKFVFKY
ncbi:DUF192 domain-containing protein [Patescibacteria group bacterium]|nr:DUF192 domain-containing protein [Patescibacteria group bacterium]MBU4023370.1 DUF192 domain-containing protein [Patescibacteria group bacterium]MBU4078534.1 DUF192 domain-containing protein [Patescibacteria group bacterium]